MTLIFPDNSNDPALTELNLFVSKEALNDLRAPRFRFEDGNPMPISYDRQMAARIKQEIRKLKRKRIH